MLVFTRKRNETIMIGDGVEVRVLRIGREGVRLGVSAPPSVPVHRREVYDVIRDENRRAATSTTSAVRLSDTLRRATAEADMPVKEPHAT